MAKVVQIQTAAFGDNINSAQGLVTTVLYDDGSVYEGSSEVVGGNYNDGFICEWSWRKVDLPLTNKPL